MNTAFKYCALKGYKQAKWYCEPALISHWMKMGARWNKDVFKLANMTLTTMIYDLPKTKNKITINTPPEILNCKEGEWFESSPIFGTFELETKEQIAHFNALSKKIKLIKSQEDNSHPPFKDNFQQTTDSVFY